MVGAKSEKFLRKWQVAKRWDRGEDPVVVGPIYRLAVTPPEYAAMAFRLEDNQWWVGFARGRPGMWVFEDGEPFSLRSLGYYERWLKRHGAFAGMLNEKGELVFPSTR